MNTGNLLVSLLASATMLWVSPAFATQELPEQLPEGEAGVELIGMIPGTEMLRDEFRARAEAQLIAVSLNALVYYVVYGEYPAGFYELRGSDTWNLDVANMFSGRQLNAIYFEPEPEDFTTQPSIGVPYLNNVPAPPVPLPTDEEGGIDYSALSESMIAAAPVHTPRVNPAAIPARDFGAIAAGDVFYYVDGDLLQLIMYAGDGSYVERVEEVPNHNWRTQLPETGQSVAWPDDVFAAQVLYFAETLLPQYYNLVLFMGERETLPTRVLGSLGAAARLTMAEELGITVLNPGSKQPAQLAAEFSVGDFIEPDPLTPVPLQLCVREARVVSQADLKAQAAPPAQPAVEQAPEREKQPASRPPLGGRK